MNTDKFIINIPSNNLFERKYIIDVFFNVFMSLDYSIKIDVDRCDYEILWKGYRIIIDDNFFLKYPDDLSYLNSDFIPSELNWFDPSPILEKKIPIVYGKNTLKVLYNNIECGLDIFASSFFMLTRWEELVLDRKDKYNTYIEDEMWIVRHDIYQRPIVNEYFNLLISLIKKLDASIELPIKSNFDVFLTHDVDRLFKYDFSHFIKNLFGDILQRKNFSLFVKSCLNYAKFKLGKIKDPCDTFDEYMFISDSFKMSSNFFFIPSIKGEKDYRYDIRDIRVKKMIDNIIDKGHNVGFHPSMSTYSNEYQFAVEYNRLQSISKQTVIMGRQHYLIYDLEKTLQYWSRNKNLRYDSGLGFNYRLGFRCGCCYEFPFFDVFQRELLNIIERPLIVMDGPLLNSKRKDDELYKYVVNLIDEVFYFNGLFVLLWHNDTLSRLELQKYKKLYIDILRYVSTKIF